MKKAIIFIIFIIIIFFLISLIIPTPEEKGQQEIAIYFRDYENVDDCEATKKIERIISSTSTPESVAVTILFDENLTDLKPFYEKVDRIGSKANIYFKREALKYLNGPACLQQSYKAPIEQTLKAEEGIEQVDYFIEGERFVEWDA